MSADPICHLNGRFVRLSRAAVSPMDSGFLYGDGVYDTLRLYNGRIHLLPAHLRRLKCHLKELSIPFGKTHRLPALFSALIRRNRILNGVIRVQITRGPQRTPPPKPRFGRPGIFVTLRRFEGYPQALYRTGVPVRLEPAPAYYLGPKPKTTNSQINILARLRAVRSSFFETIFFHDNRILEGSMTNLFLVRGMTLSTPPPEGILSGVTRAEIMKLAGSMGLKVDERACTVQEALKADEIFLTSTTLEVMPISRLLSGRRVRTFSAHPVATLLRTAYRLRLP